jgi:hypothetical protein
MVGGRRLKEREGAEVVDNGRDHRLPITGRVSIRGGRQADEGEGGRTEETTGYL